MLRRAFVACLAVSASMSVGASAATVISGNFCSVAPVVDFPAGLIPVGNWNDLTGPAGFGPTGSKPNPIYSDGSTALGAVISWSTSDGGSQNTNDAVIRPMPPATLGNHIDDGHDQLMTGYLQASKHSSSEPVITLRMTGLDVSKFGGSYDVILYFDGDDDIESNTARVRFSVWSSLSAFQSFTAPLATVYGRDPVNVNFPVTHTIPGFLGDYVQITSTDEFNPTAGNYVRFSGLTNSEFYVRMVGVAGQHGVALNGFQVVPEPGAAMALAGGVAMLLGLRPRRTR